MKLTLAAGESRALPYADSTVVAKDVGLEVSAAFVPSSVGPSVNLTGLELNGPYKTALRLDQCWNATVLNPFIAGPLGDEAEYANPTQMQVGIELVGAMDAHITNPRITCANVGIKASTHPDGYPRSEGLHITDGFLMHVNTGIRLEGSMLGGWPTPVVHVRGPHVAFNKYGIYAQNIAFLHLTDVNWYASNYQRNQWCVYLVNCKNVQIRGCDFWSNWAIPGFLGGIVLDACEDVDIDGGTFVSSITLALHATPTCKRVRLNGKVWDDLTRQGKVVNRSSA